MIETSFRYANPIPTFAGPATRARQDRIAAENAPQVGVFENTLVGDAVLSFNSIGSIAQAIQRGGYERDPNWAGVSQLPRDLRDQFLNGLEYEQIVDLANARSFDHAAIMVGQFRQQNAAKARLGQAGLVGVAATLGAAIIDPIALPLSVGSGGAAFALTVGRLGRMRAMAAAGLVGGLTEIGIEGARSHVDPTVGMEDMLYASVGGILGGGIGGALAAGHHVKSLRKVENIVGRTRFAQAQRAEEIVRKRLELRMLADEIDNAVPIADDVTFENAAPTSQLSGGAGTRRRRPGTPEPTGAVDEYSPYRDVVAMGAASPNDPRFIPTPRSRDLEAALYRIGMGTRQYMNDPLGNTAAQIDKAKRVLTDKGKAYFDDIASRKARSEQVKSMGRMMGFADEGDEAAFNRVADEYPDEAMEVLLGSKYVNPDVRAGDLDDLAAPLGPNATRRPDGPEPQAGGGGGDDIDTGVGPNTGPPGDMEPGDFVELGINASPASRPWGLPRFGTIGVADATDDEFVMWFVRGAVEDVLVPSDGNPTRLPLSLWTEAEAAPRVSRMRETFNRERSLLNEGVPKDQIVSFRDFSKQVYRAVIRGNFDDTPVGRTAAFIRDQNQELLERLKRHRAAGYEDVVSDPTHMPRRYNLPGLTRALRDHGYKGVTRLFRRAYETAAKEDLVQEEFLKLDGVKKADGELLDAAERMKAAERAAQKRINALADAMPRVIEALKYGDANLQQRIINADVRTIEETATAIRRQIDKDPSKVADFMESQELRNIVFEARRRGDEGARFASSRKRVSLNETAEITFSDGRKLSMEDLLETDAYELMSRRQFTAHGEMGAARLYSGMGRLVDPTGKTDYLSFAQMEQGLRDHWVKQRLSEDVINKRLSVMRAADRFARRIPQETFNDPLTRKLVEANRVLRHMAYFRFGPGFLFAQVSEVVGSIFENGIDATSKQMPVLRTLQRDVMNGTAKGQGLLRDIEIAFSPGSADFRDRWWRSFETSDDGFEDAMGVLARGSRAAARFGGKVSGTTGLIMHSQQKNAAITMQRMVDVALSGRPMSKKRLAAAGLTEADWTRLSAAIRTEAKLARGLELEQGIMGGQLHRWKPGMWDDQEIARKFQDAIMRISRRQIQEVDAGQLHPFMTKEFGKMMLQFRSFSIAAYEKQLLFNAQMRDEQSFHRLMGEIVGAIAATLALTHSRSLRIDDESKRKEYRTKRLGPKEFATQVFQRMGISSIVPSVYDTAAEILPYIDPAFHYRSSGFGTNLISLDNTPVIRTANDMWQSTGGLIAGIAPFDTPMTEKTFRDFGEAFGPRNWLPYDRAMELLISPLPENPAELNRLRRERETRNLLDPE